MDEIEHNLARIWNVVRDAPIQSEIADPVAAAPQSTTSSPNLPEVYSAPPDPVASEAVASDVSESPAPNSSNPSPLVDSKTQTIGAREAIRHPELRRGVIETEKPKTGGAQFTSNVPPERALPNEPVGRSLLNWILRNLGLG